jgi:hypothetical protein
MARVGYYASEDMPTRQAEPRGAALASPSAPAAERLRVASSNVPAPLPGNQLAHKAITEEAAFPRSEQERTA